MKTECSFDKDGGPAFPRPGFRGYETESQQGMSLRDWFAGKALQGLLAMCAGRDVDAGFLEDAARRAYECADDMIAERNKKP